MLKKNKKGRLIFQSVDFAILIGDMFEICESEHEIDWLEDELRSAIECIAQEKRDGVL